MEDKLNQAEAKKKLGNDAFAKKDYKIAIELYSEAIELDPQNHIYYSNRSACYAAEKDFAGSMKDAQMCVKIEPSFAKGYYRLAVAQLELGSPDEAVSTIRDGLKQDPGHKDLARLLQKMKKQKKGTRSNKAPKFDASSAKELRELEESYQQTERELQEVQGRLMSSQREQKMISLTSKQIENVPETNKMYRSVGKMFMLTPKADMDGILQEQGQTEKKTQTELMSRRKYLQRRITSQEENIKDLMQNAMERA